jgi:hypothetical protein
MLAVANSQDVAIAWWRKVLDGATVNDLHHSWGLSNSLVLLMRGWRYLNFIAPAALAAKLAIIDSILLRRATQTYQGADPPRNLTMQTPHMTDFPVTGTVSSSDKVVSSVKIDFQNNIAKLWGGEASAGSTLMFQGCDGICQGTFGGIGFAFNTSSATVPEQVNLSDSEWQNGSSVPLFDVSFEMSWASGNKSYSSIFINMFYFTADNITGDCTGSLTHA